MAWYEVKLNGDGSDIPDGNNIQYPISQAPSGDKAYLENSIQDISLAIQTEASSGDKYKVSEMAAAIRALHSGLNATQLMIYTAEITNVGPLEST